MSRNEDTTVNEKNIGGIGRNRGPRADSDLSGGVTRVEGEKGLETADRARTYAPDVSRYCDPVKGGVLDKIGDIARRMVGDPVGLIEREALLDAPRPLDNHSRPVERIKDCKIDPPVGLVHGDTLVLKLNGIMGVAPDVIECLGQRYVHEERVEEARQTTRTRPLDDNKILRDLGLSAQVLLGIPEAKPFTFADAARVHKNLSDAIDEIRGLRDDVRAAEKAAEDWRRLLDDAKDGWDKSIAETKQATKAADEFKAAAFRNRDEANLHYAELKELRAKVAELSKVRVFNVAGLVEKDLAERYESLRAAHDLMIANYQAVQAERDEARAKVEEQTEETRGYRDEALLLREAFDKLAEQRAKLKADLREARALIAESAPVVRYVERLASLSDEDADALDARDIRSMARDNFANREAWASALDPRTYTDEQRAFASRAIVGRLLHSINPSDTVDVIAEALGMRRAQ